MIHVRFSYKKLGGILILLLFVVACTTEKDALVNRWFHQSTTKYNGYYNANDLMKEAMKGYNSSRKEDFTDLLPIEALPSDEEAQALYPAMDTAVSKCTKVIAKHSMPSIETGKKTDEYNKWMDEVWLAIGRSKYIKRQYDDAIKNFKYITKFFKHDAARFWGNLWIAKTDIQVGDLRQAEILIKQIERDLDDVKNQDEEKEKATKSKSKLIRKKNKKKGKEEDEKPIKIPKDFNYELLKVKASLALENNKLDEAQKFLSDALKDSKFKQRKERARLYFILGQLSVINGDHQQGIKSYTLVLKNEAKYDMYFTARLNRAMAAGAVGGGDKLRKELNKMLRDEKNFEFKDQIYYALGDMDISGGDQVVALQEFTKSAFYSINNVRQKGMSYERMGNIFFTQKDYVKAQKYYDSCVAVIPEDYKNYAVVKNKADKLANLVAAVETVEREDSLLRIAELSPEEQERFAKKVKKQVEDEQQKQREANAMRVAALQELQNKKQSSGGSGKWYFYDQKQRTEGYDAFKKLWGQRQIEDNWRRSQKVAVISFTDQEDTTAVPDSLNQAPAADSLTVESLLADIPNSDSAVAASKSRLMAALYESGRIYEQELEEPQLAIKQFENCLNRSIESPNKLLSAYELYKIYMPTDESKSSYYKDMILNNYPNSDFANYIRDPDYFIKQKEREKVDLEDFEKSVERYRSGLFGLVKAKSNLIITTEPDNAFRSKYMLLYAMAAGQSMDNKEDLIPDLEAIYQQYPNTDEANRAIEMVHIIKTGYSKDVKLDFGSTSNFDYDATSSVFFIVLLDPKDDANKAKTDLSNYNREFFSEEHVKTQGSQLSAEQPTLIVREFQNDIKAKRYLAAFEGAKKYIDYLNGREHFLISGANYAKLISTNDLKGYLSFYKDFYK